MRTILFFSIVLTILSTSCSKEKAVEIPAQQQICELGINLKPLTECCVAGPIQARAGQIITATYYSSFVGGSYNWKVLGNSLQLVEGQNSATAKFKVLSNFKKDTILVGAVARGAENGAPSCSEFLIINAY